MKQVSQYNAVITRDEVYIADEAFLGTAAEVTPIRDVDNYVIGNGLKEEPWLNSSKKRILMWSMDAILSTNIFNLYLSFSALAASVGFGQSPKAVLRNKEFYASRFERLF